MSFVGQLWLWVVVDAIVQFSKLLVYCFGRTPYMFISEPKTFSTAFCDPFLKLPSFCDFFPHSSYHGPPFCSLCLESKSMSLSKCFLFPIMESNSKGKQGKRKKEIKKCHGNSFTFSVPHGPLFQDPLVTKQGCFSSSRCLYLHWCCNCCCCKTAVSGMRFTSGHSQEDDDWGQQQQKAGYVL